MEVSSCKHCHKEVDSPFSIRSGLVDVWWRKATVIPILPPCITV